MRIKALIVILFMALFSSCSEEVSEPLESVSKDGKMSISVIGKRYSSFDPFMVEVKATLDESEFPVSLEIQADALTSENVRFEWRNNRGCTVSITQRDGSIIPIPVAILK